MALLLDILSWVLIAGGSAFAVVGGIGIIRLPDFYARLHGGGITDTMGAGLLMAGLMVASLKVGLMRLAEPGWEGGFQAGPWLVMIKLAMILFFLLITSPTGCHALAQAALAQGVQPRLDDSGSEPSQ